MTVTLADNAGICHCWGSGKHVFHLSECRHLIVGSMRVLCVRCHSEPKPSKVDGSAIEADKRDVNSGGDHRGRRSNRCPTSLQQNVAVNCSFFVSRQRGVRKDVIGELDRD